MFLEVAKRMRFVLTVRGKFAFEIKNWWSMPFFKQVQLLEEY
nr:hypothetical protein [Macrococcus goetzii]